MSEKEYFVPPLACKNVMVSNCDCRRQEICGRYLLNGRGCSAPVGHRYIEHGGKKSLWYFLFVTGEKKTTIWVRQGFHCFVKYSDRDKAKPPVRRLKFTISGD